MEKNEMLKAEAEKATRLQLFFLQNSGLPVTPRAPPEIIIHRAMESCMFKSSISFVAGN